MFQTQNIFILFSNVDFFFFEFLYSPAQMRIIYIMFVHIYYKKRERWKTKTFFYISSPQLFVYSLKYIFVLGIAFPRI